jgi:hypothetical protein
LWWQMFLQDSVQVGFQHQRHSVQEFSLPSVSPAAEGRQWSEHASFCSGLEGLRIQIQRPTSQDAFDSFAWPAYRYGTAFRFSTHRS